MKFSRVEHLTQNFSLSEFQSRDGAEMPASVYKNVLKLAANLETIRGAAGCSLHINSGYRSPEHNAAVGGAHNSQHLSGNAADIVPTGGVSVQELHDIIKALMDIGHVEAGGLKAYYKNGFVHYDRRGEYTTW